MVSSQRICGPVLTNLSSATVFAGLDEHKRMASLRTKIAEVRRIWHSNEQFLALKAKIRSYINHENLSPKTLVKIEELLKGYSDWADMDYHRPEPQQQRWTAIEIYCSEEGYNLLFGIFNAVLREKDTADEVLLIAAALVELVTIELYNLRLSNIGDPRYSNYEGITYRGMSVSKEMVEEYRKVAMNPDLSKRHFGVPLGFTSSSTDTNAIKQFIKQKPGDEHMHWVIHIRGLDPRLLKRYEERYPDSVVTSITAMPVGRIAELREKEVLLRGAFFHIVTMESKQEEGGRNAHTLHLVVMNTNRDHGTELSLDEGAKQEQRNFFRDMIIASRFRICADLLRVFSKEEARGYEELADIALRRIDGMDDLTDSFEGLSLGTTPLSVTTWHGNANEELFPSNHLALRKRFHSAASQSQWREVQEILTGEYDWEVAEWFNTPAIGVKLCGSTPLHEMARLGPPAQDSKHFEGWQYLLEKLEDYNVWKSLKTQDTLETASQIARRSGFESLADAFEPQFKISINSNVVEFWQNKLHELIKCSETKARLTFDKFYMPQLSVLCESSDMALWIPLPGIYAGYVVRITQQHLAVERFETSRSEAKTLRTRHQL